jgi:hypothetical protein
MPRHSTRPSTTRQMTGSSSKSSLSLPFPCSSLSSTPSPPLCLSQLGSVLCFRAWSFLPLSLSLSLSLPLCFCVNVF